MKSRISKCLNYVIAFLGGKSLLLASEQFFCFSRLSDYGIVMINMNGFFLLIPKMSSLMIY